MDVMGNEILVLEDEESWKAERLKGVGGSDAAVVMGASKWNSTYSLWFLKRGLTVDDEQSEAAMWGSTFEGQIRDHFCEKYGIRVDIDPDFSTRVDPEYPFLRASLDGYIVPGQDLSRLPFEVDQSTFGIYEGKTTSVYMLEHWAEGPPKIYYYQAQHYMMVTGAAYTIFSTLFGGNTHEVYLTHRDDNVIEIMRETEIEFWRRVVEDEPPDVDGHEKTKETLDSMYDVGPEDFINFSKEAGEWADEIVTLKEEISAREEKKNLLENKLRDEMKGATVGYLPDEKFKYTNKARVNKAGKIVRTLRKSRA